MSRRKSTCLLLALIFVMSVIASLLIMFTNLSVNAETETKEQRAERFTSRDSFEYNGQNYLLEDYPDLYFKVETIGIDVETGASVVKENDAILNIIPYEYFLSEGQYSYSGSVYGFFVDNFIDAAGTLHNIVVVYKYLNNLGETYSFKAQLIPLFEFEFLTIKKEEGMFKAYEYNPGRIYKKSNYIVTQSYYCQNYSEPMVVAAPQKGILYVDQFDNCNKYYLQNIKHAIKLSLLQDVQKGEEGYDIFEDKATIIQGTYFSYQGGAIREKSIMDKVVEGTTGTAKVIGETIIGTIMEATGAGVVWNVVNFSVPIVKVLLEEKYSFTTENNKNNYKSTFDHQTQAQAGEYCRSAKIEFDMSDGRTIALRPKNLLINEKEDDYLEMSYTLSHQSLKNYTYRSLLQGQYVFSLSTIDGSENYYVDSNYETIIGDQFKPIEEDKVTMDYVTDDFSSYFKFTPQNSGSYEIFTKGKYKTQLDLYSDTNLSRKLASGQALDGNNTLIRLNLNKGITYYLRADTIGVIGRRIFPIVINFIPNEIHPNENKNGQVSDLPIRFSYLGAVTKNLEFRATTASYRLVARVQILDEQNSKQNIIVGESGDGLQFLAKAGVRYIFEVSRSELESAGTSFPVTLELRDGKAMQFGEKAQMMKGQNYVKFTAPLQGKYLIEYDQNDIRNLVFYTAVGTEIPYESQTKSVALMQGDNFIGLQTVNGEKLSMSLYTGNQGTFTIGEREEETFIYSRLSGCNYLKLNAREGMYKIIGISGGNVKNIYYTDFSHPLTKINDIFYFKDGIYYVEIEGSANGTLKVIKTDLENEFNINVQNNDKTIQTEQLLKGNPYSIVILDRQGKIVELENVSFTLKYGNKTINIEGDTFTVPFDAEVGKELEIIGSYNGSEFSQKYLVINPFSLALEEYISVDGGKMVVNYLVNAEEMGILNGEYVLNLTYTFHHAGNAFMTETVNGIQEELSYNKEFTGARRYGELTLVLRLDYVVGNQSFNFDFTEKLDRNTQSMPASSSTLSSETLFLTHADVVNNITYVIDPSVKLLSIQGKNGYQYKTKFVIKDRNEPLLLYLMDFKSKAGSGNAIESVNRTLCLWSYGTSELVGGKGTAKSFTPNNGEKFSAFNARNTNKNTKNGGHAIQGKQIYLGGDKLKLVGGDGANGIGFGTQTFYSTVLYTYISGENGGQGGNGIYTYGTVDIKLKSFEAHGGNGGYGADGKSQFVKYDLSAFYSGYEGVRGGHGGNGGIAVECDRFIANELSADCSIKLYSGNGGYGGNGGSGKDGLNGASGSSVAPDGENGYNGGSGGNGGSSGYVLKTNKAEANLYSVITLYGGNGGNGGRGGDGGDGGDGKSTSTWTKKGGNGGDGGYAGTGGNALTVTAVNISGNLGWTIHNPTPGTGGRGGAGGIGGQKGTGGFMGSDGQKGETRPNGSNGRVVTS